MSSLRAVITLIVFPLLARAHMQMSSPYPINSPLDPTTPEANKDYDYTSPLAADGSDFPCKGYAAQTPFTSKATYQAGNQYQMTIAGTANHDGGSCQLSLSYDNGQTFKVIKSMIGGCPITTTYNFTIPDFAPSGDVLFAWSWFNLIGNREMYMDCAQVTVQGATPGRHRRSQWRRQNTMASLPDLFVADVNQPSQCTTVEGQDVQFPNPGSIVQYGNDSTTTQPGTGFSCENPSAVDVAGDDGTDASNTTTGYYSTGSSPSATSIMNGTDTSTTTVSSTTTTTTTTTISGSGSTVDTTTSTGATSESTTSPAAASTTSSYPSSTSPAFSSATVSSNPSSTTSASSSASSTPSGPCTPGTFACNSLTSFSQCVSSGDYVFMGSTAAGTVCDNGQIVRQTDGPCTPDGSLQCGSNNFTFYLCDQGGLVNMGPVAAGTECIDGQIVYAQ